MIKKAIISGVLFSLILLVGCNRESEVVVIDDSKNGENESKQLSDSNWLSELQNEIIVSITEQTELDSESIESIMVGGSPSNGIIDVSISFPKDAKVDDAMIQQIIEDSIKNVSETENVAISEEDITIKIGKY